MNGQDPITTRARALFDRAADGLDPGTAQRLRQARRTALQPTPRRLNAFVPAGAFAAAVLALGLAWWLPPRPGVAPAAPATTTADAGIDQWMVEEDPELYAWLADAPVATAGNPR